MPRSSVSHPAQDEAADGERDEHPGEIAHQLQDRARRRSLRRGAEQRSKERGDGRGRSPADDQGNGDRRQPDERSAPHDPLQARRHDGQYGLGGGKPAPLKKAPVRRVRLLMMRRSTTSRTGSVAPALATTEAYAAAAPPGTTESRPQRRDLAYTLSGPPFDPLNPSATLPDRKTVLLNSVGATSDVWGVQNSRVTVSGPERYQLFTTLTPRG